MGMASQLKNMRDAFAVIASFPEYRHSPIVIGESDPEGCAARCVFTTQPSTNSKTTIPITLRSCLVSPAMALLYLSTLISASWQAGLSRPAAPRRPSAQKNRLPLPAGGLT
jgi:hypothetical protein